MDWAEILVEAERKRGNNNITKETLRCQVEKQCELNINRWKKENRWSEETTKIEFEKEMQRLISLKNKENDREQLEYDYSQKGIEIVSDHSQSGKIDSVKIDLTPEEWVDVLNKEGEYLHSCCAEVSRIRDVLQSACREDGHIQVEDLKEIALLIKHHGFDDNNVPINKITNLWEAVKKDVREHLINKSANVKDPKHALKILGEACETMRWHELANNDEFNKHANVNYTLATIKTAVHTLYFQLKEITQNDIEGYGIISENGEIGYSSVGLAIYREKSIAEEACKYWKNHSVKKVRISPERGVVLI